MPSFFAVFIICRHRITVFPLEIDQIVSEWIAIEVSCLLDCLTASEQFKLIDCCVDVLGYLGAKVDIGVYNDF